MIAADHGEQISFATYLLPYVQQLRQLISLFTEDGHFFIEIKILRSKMKSRSHDRKKIFFA